MGKIIGNFSRTGRVQLPLKYRVRLLPFEGSMEFLYQVYIVIPKFTIIIILIFILPPWDPPWWPPGRPWWPPGRPCPRLCWTSVSSGSPEDSSVVQTDTRASIILCIQYILFCCWSELLPGNIPHICIFFNFTTLRWCRICARTGMTQSLIVVRCWFELLQQPETQNNQRYAVTQTIPSQCKKDGSNVYKNEIIGIIWSRYTSADKHSVELM